MAEQAPKVPPRDPATEGPDPNALGELRASAQATMDAAAHLHSPASPVLIAVRDALAAVGLAP
ncbi:MAG: hypothetical protein JWM90_877 [Thermoleophilia bacterium]|nr:hypothetical protein [Thermoleophilia bacterium]